MSALKIAAVQYDIKWLDKQVNLSSLGKIIAEYFENQKSIDLLLLPETFATGFCLNQQEIDEPEDGGLVLDWLKEIARDYQCVVAGSVLVSHKGKKVNRFYWVWPDGTLAHYDKRHLFRMGNEQEFVLAGNERKIFEINGIKILPQVCYDLRFPVWCRNQQDYDLMVNVANWPAARRNIWDTLLKARAMENQAYVIGVNRVGDDGRATQHSGGTAIYDFTGQTIQAAEDNQQQVITAELDFTQLKKFKEAFPAFLDADKFELR